MGDVVTCLLVDSMVLIQVIFFLWVQAFSEIALNYEKLRPDVLPVFESYATCKLVGQIHKIRIIEGDKTGLYFLTVIRFLKFPQVACCNRY